MFVTKNICWMFPLKEKTDNISFIIRRMTTEKTARAVGIPPQGAGMRQVSLFFFFFFFENVINPGLLPTDVAVYDKPNWTPHFQVASHFGRRPSTIGGLCRRATYPIRIAVSRQRLLLSLCCSNTPYDGGNVVCFSFQWNIQQMSCETKNAAKARSRAPRAFCVFEHFPCCTWSFAVYQNNYHWIRML